MSQQDSLKKLVGEFNAAVWAEEFVKAAAYYPSLPLDKAAMTTWFANAIMAGYDHAAKAKRV